jgi:hypothetical protein
VASVTVMPEEIPMTEKERETVEEKWSKGDYSRRVREGKSYCLQISVCSTFVSAILRKSQPERQQARLDTTEGEEISGLRRPSATELLASVCWASCDR